MLSRLLVVVCAIVGVSAACDPCECDADGVVDGFVTNRGGCDTHGLDTDPFCYMQMKCNHPLATVSQSFPELKYMRCNLAMATDATSDECDANAPVVPTPAPTVLMCPADGEWASTTPDATAELECATDETGTRTRKCQANGTWRAAVDTCVKAPTCTDKVQNGEETGLDCGGPSCPDCLFCAEVNCGVKGQCNEASKKCICLGGYTGDRCNTPPADPCDGKACNNPYGSCTNGICTCVLDYTGPDCETAPVPTCTDGLQNGQETGVDCGPTALVGKECPLCDGGARWNIGAWETCSQLCGGGVAKRTVKCVEDSGPNGGSFITVSDDKCKDLHPVDSTQVCNEQLCGSYAWKVQTAWDACSMECGVGYRSRSVACVSNPSGDDWQDEVDPEKCGTAIKPNTMEPCNTDVCTTPGPRWEPQLWKECSATCGGGTQSRDVPCLNNDQSIEPDETKCGAKPSTTRSCNLKACRVFRWQACAWDDCTASCNGATGMLGIMHRLVMCRDAVGNIADSSLCNSTTAPVSFVEGCETQACDDFNWMADGPWSLCLGYNQARTFHCHAPDGRNEPKSSCSTLPLPPSSRSCRPQMCPEDINPEDTSAGFRALPLLASMLSALALMGSGNKLQWSLYGLVLLALLSPTAHAAPLPVLDHHYGAVTDLKLIEAPGCVNPGVSKSNHPTPFCHDLLLSFNTPSENFTLSLSLMHGLFHDDLVDESYDADGKIVYTKPSLRAYTAAGHNMRGSISVYSLSSVSGVIRTRKDMYTLVPADRVEGVPRPDSGVLFYQERDLVRATPSSRRVLEQEEGHVDFHGRNLLQFQGDAFNKQNCFTGFNGDGTTFTLGVGADEGFQRAAGSGFRDVILEMVADSSAVYREQFKVSLQISNQHYPTLVGTPSWNMFPTNPGSKSCAVNSAGKDLDLFKAWAAGEGQSKSPKVGTWHLFTNCFPPSGVVGVAYVGVLCNKGGFASGLSTWQSSRTWLTFAHELGHNFNAGHSFEEGQGSTGGIMDYGDGKKNGVYQFNRQYRQTQICDGITEGQTIDNGANICFKPPTPTSPTPPPTPRVRNCATTMNHKKGLCDMWKSMNYCTIGAASAGQQVTDLVVEYMESTCGQTCCMSSMEVEEPQPRTVCSVPLCATCVSRYSCETCQPGTQLLHGQCYAHTQLLASSDGQWPGGSLQLAGGTYPMLVLNTGDKQTGVLLSGSVTFAGGVQAALEVAVEDRTLHVTVSNAAENIVFDMYGEKMSPLALVSVSFLDDFVTAVGGIQVKLPFDDMDGTYHMSGVTLSDLKLPLGTYAEVHAVAP